MSDPRSEIKVIAIDLVDTLVQHGISTFLSVATNFLAGLGRHVDILSFRQLFRERFLEYTLGNYRGDEEFLAVLRQ